MLGGFLSAPRDIIFATIALLLPPRQIHRHREGGHADQNFQAEAAG